MRPPHLPFSSTASLTPVLPASAWGGGGLAALSLGFGVIVGFWLGLTGGVGSIVAVAILLVAGFVIDRSVVGI